MLQKITQKANHMYQKPAYQDGYTNNGGTLWKIMEDTIIHPRNNTFDSHILLTTKQLKEGIN